MAKLYVVPKEKVAEQLILTKCSTYNTFQAICDVVHDFRNFNVLKIVTKTHNKIIKKDPHLILTQGNLFVAWYIYAR